MQSKASPPPPPPPTPPHPQPTKTLPSKNKLRRVFSGSCQWRGAGRWGGMGGRGRVREVENDRPVCTSIPHPLKNRLAVPYGRVGGRSPLKRTSNPLLLLLLLTTIPLPKERPRHRRKLASPSLREVRPRMTGVPAVLRSPLSQMPLPQPLQDLQRSLSLSLCLSLFLSLSLSI